MLLPDKHITLAESLFGLGAFILQHLDRPKTMDQLYQKMQGARDDGSFPAFHDFDSLVLAISFLYAVGAVEADQIGVLRKCAS